MVDSRGIWTGQKDIIDQGFAEGSFDVIIASLVLHATRNLDRTLQNVRKLLKPGGYLLLLEITENEQMRFGILFGGLPGWWLGYDDDQPQPSQHLDATPPRLDWTWKALDVEMSDEEGLASFGNQSPNQPAGTGKPPEVTMWTTSMESYTRLMPPILSPPALQGAIDGSFMDYMSTAIPLSDQNLYNSTWTNVTQDMGLVQHLLALYFCWEYPTFASIHKEYFLADFISGRQEYCSVTLVNTLLSLGCLISSGATLSDESQALSDHFFKESLRLTAQENDQYALTNIQSMGILAIREARCGRNTESRCYAGQSMRLALEIGTRQVGNVDDEGIVAVSNTTFWGAFALDSMWSMVAGVLPITSRAPLLPPRPPMNADIEAAPWTPYPPEGKFQVSHYYSGWRFRY